MSQITCVSIKGNYWKFSYVIAQQSTKAFNTCTIFKWLMHYCKWKLFGKILEEIFDYVTILVILSLVGNLFSTGQFTVNLP